MVQVRFPPNSVQKLNPLAGFPQRILFKRYSHKAKYCAGLKVHWTFQDCGCYTSQFSSPNAEVYGHKCTEHGGLSRCFYDKPLK